MDHEVNLRMETIQGGGNQWHDPPHSPTSLETYGDILIVVMTGSTTEVWWLGAMDTLHPDKYRTLPGRA